MQQPPQSLASDLLAAFQPNRTVSRTTLQILIGAETLIFLLIWWKSPFEVLPRPTQVASALGALWATVGLGRVLWIRFKATLEAGAITLIISVGLSSLSVRPVWRPVLTAISKGPFIGLTGLTLLF